MKTPKIKEFKVFVPCSPNGIDESIQFYRDLGFSPVDKGGDICCIDTNQGTRFLLRNRYNKELAENLMLHLWVEDLNEWKIFLDSLDLNKKYSSVNISEPKDEPWGLRVIYIWDPAGVLLHIAQSINS